MRHCASVMRYYGGIMKRQIQAFVRQAHPSLAKELRALNGSPREGAVRRGLRVACELERIEILHEKGQTYVLLQEQAEPDSVIGLGLAPEVDRRPPAGRPEPPPPRPAAPGGRSLPTYCLAPRLLGQRPILARAIRAGWPC
jgi:hypothetical protein